MQNTYPYILRLEKYKVNKRGHQLKKRYLQERNFYGQDLLNEEGFRLNRLEVLTFHEYVGASKHLEKNLKYNFM